MTESLPIALLHMAVSHGRPDENRAALLAMAEEAAQTGARLIVAPEMCVSGYAMDGPEEAAKYAEDLRGETVAELAALAKRHEVYCAAGFAEREPHANILHNSAALIDPNGDVVAVHRKISLERRWACPGFLSRSSSAETPWGRIGLLICADTYYGILPRAQALYGVDLLLVPANWPPSGLDPRELWRARAIENGIGIVACNRTGIDPSMDCRACSSFAVTEDGEALVDGSSPTSAIWRVNYPLVDGKFRSKRRETIMALRHPERYGALALDMNGLQDFAGLWSLPDAGELDICCVVPGRWDTAQGLVDGLIEKRLHETTPCLAVWPRMAGRLCEDLLAKLWKHDVFVAGLLTPPGTCEHRVGLFNGEYHWLSNDEDAVIADVLHARVALVHHTALRHPETAISLSKRGCDAAAAVLDALGDDDRLCLGVKCLERMAVAIAADSGAAICMPPEGHRRWAEQSMRGPGTCSARLDTSTLRKKHFQDRVSMEALLSK